jgi:hypothetical protein
VELGGGVSPGRGQEIKLGEWDMTHYSLEQWVDFARNVVGEDEKREMENHLKIGCVRCSKELDIWQHLHKVARRDSAYQPADGAVRTVNASFANRTAHRPGRARSGVAALLFDSFRSPVLAGTRSTATTSRQVLYGAGTYRIDVRIEPQMDSENVILIGQVLNSANPEERLPELPVTLFKGPKILARSTTKQFGEFQIECALDGGFRLMVMLPGNTEVTLPLIDPALGIEERQLHANDSTVVKRNSSSGKKGTRTND